MFLFKELYIQTTIFSEVDDSRWESRHRYGKKFCDNDTWNLFLAVCVGMRTNVGVYKINTHCQDSPGSQVF